MASLDDILTTQKNGVVGINELNRTTIQGIGSNTSATVTTENLVIVGPGRLVNFCVVVAGTSTGGIYNFNAISGMPASAQLVTVPNTIGVYQCNQVFNVGLVIAPGTGQSINVTYSVG
jgi:hypothetical protein